ncbi:MAG: 30S ribosomal protein S5 [Spirochaetes bacterium]|mgnify:FL=1|nr:30S ribosomal protein S5 [Spirochaetota bacterium]
MEQGRDKDFTEKLIKLNRVAKVVKGGRRFSFSAIVVVGDKAGSVGFGYGKANDVSEAIRKGVDRAKKNLMQIPLKRSTIPHEVIGEFKSARVLMKPAAPGTGIIAGGPVRAVMEVSGINDVLSKSMGSQNAVNLVKAVFEGFSRIMDAREIAKNRGKTLQELWG